MNRLQLLAEARREVERRRQRAQAQAAKKSAQLLQAHPQLAALDAARAETGALAARLAADGQMDAARECLAKVKQISAERQALLARLGTNAEALEPAWTCPECQDTGRKNGVVCACVLEEMRRLRRADINASSPLSLCSFANFNLELYPMKMEGFAASPRALMERIFADCRDWAAEFGPHSKSLYMYGDAGLGKTHLALSIAGEVLAAGHDVIYVSAHNAFARISDERFDGGSELFQSMLEADLLVLDDLGTEYLDAYVRGKLYELVNTRLYRRPTIYTTNIWRKEQLEQRYDEKISSRLLGECHLMRFFGHDIRLQKRHMH